MSDADPSPDLPARPSLAQKTILLAIVVAPILALVYAMVLLWNRAIGAVDLTLFLVLYVLTTLGIGVGFHRMLTHKGFDAPAPVRFVFLVLGSMAMEGPCLDWAATHTKHHAKSDREGDPHSPLEGFWHAHLGWLFRRGLKAEELYYRGFRGDRTAAFVGKTFWVWAVLSFAIPFGVGFAFGGWSGAWTGVVWGALVRIFFNQHVTWSVNSVCHTFGTKAFRTPDRSRNEWIVGLLALGEGWHNNHHAFPRSAVHGLRWYQFDLSGWVIRLLKLVRLARNVFIVPKEQWQSRLRRRPAKARTAA
jgi:stearoyl-CoA desaturase (Delta-9 desaturase)